MPNRNYIQGYRYERREQKHWNDLGYWVHRNYGSKGMFDLVAFSSEEVVVISVKSFTNRAGGYKADAERLRSVIKSAGLRRLQVVYGPIKSGTKTPRKEVEV